jgi:hypothetical protein
MIDNSKEYIICAAIWYKHRFRTPAPRGFLAQNISKGMVIGHWRHGNCIYTHKQTRLCRCISDGRQVQGFLTSKGRFVDRWQAMEIAYNAGQVSEQDAIKKDYTGIYVSSEEFQNQVPHERYTNNDGNGWEMMFSEHLY